MIRVDCPSCQASFTVDKSEAGKKTRCPSCGQRIQVPNPKDQTLASILMPPGALPPDTSPAISPDKTIELTQEWEDAEPERAEEFHVDLIDMLASPLPRKRPRPEAIPSPDETIVPAPRSRRFADEDGSNEKEAPPKPRRREGAIDPNLAWLADFARDSPGYRPCTHRLQLGSAPRSVWRRAWRFWIEKGRLL
jgi:predicted Zn finger-like uncharacterized protein